ncbi:Retrovirus-related Pol polyprotein from transposon TNT 1-94 [Vitis vinifera]|uniref:Retrovirus-related Pol polyprotein from transposon TNT 1-94 n=1 Tax=Vitis vinifera TaxID=29760 RepID=A0A438KQW4_VITVI|nr:Retrovirus-related Pol polyprotein from transposon TNT 1-94 [Vitis vinifera]
MLSEATEFISKMSIEPNAKSRVHCSMGVSVSGDVELGKFVCNHLFKMEPENTAIIHSGQISLAISQSDHLSLWPSLIPVISPCSQSQGRKRFPVGRIVVRKHSPPALSELFRRRFFLHRKERLEEISNFSQSTGARKPSTRRPRAFFGRRLHLTRRRVRAREPLSGDALPPPARLTPTSHPSYLFLPSEPCTCLFWGSFASAGPPISFSGVLRLFFLNSNPCTCLGKCSSTFPVHDKIRNGIITSIQRHVTRIRGRSEIPNLGGSDSSPILITGHKLNGHNYLQWSQSVLLFICGKGKDEYLTGEAAMPETTEPGFRKWKIENSMIMSWLINSMNNDIELFQVESAYMTSAKESSQLLSITTHSQGIGSNLTYSRLTHGNVRMMQQHTGKLEAFSEVRREESRKKVMMGSKEQPAPTLDASALAARSFNSSGGDRQKRDRPWCDYSTVDRDGRAHVAANSESTSVPEPSPFNKEQMEMLQKLLSQVGSGSTTGIAFTANRGGMKPWIVDTGASDHMTGDAAILQNYKPSNGHSSVHIADGSKSKIVGTGSIKLTKDLYLDSVLHVPNLDCNLLSISKLARDLQCVTKFYPNSCVFQDLKSGKMIGSAELCSGLYLLSCGQFSNQVSQASCVQSQILKSDNAKEYFTSSLSTYLQNHGIIHISSCVDTPQQNGVAERKNRHLLEVARCLMFSSNVPNYFWGEAILTATYLINPSSDLPLKVFGCTAFVHVYPQNRSKFAPRANKCIFLGYSPTQKGYKCYSPTNKRFYTTMDVSFFEHVFFYPKSHVQGESMNEHQVWESLLEVQPAQHTNVPSPVTIQSPMPIQPIAPQLANENLQVYIRRRKRQELEHGSQSTCGQYIDSNSSLPEENIGEDRAGEVLIPSIDDSTLPIALRKGVRRCTDHPIGNYVTYEGLSPSYRAFATSLDDTQVPNTIQEAFKISEWKKAVQDEIDALEKNGTWTITDLPVGKRPVGCKWIFTIKYKADGSVERFKARLDSSLIGCQSRLVLATTGHKKWFLNGDLEEEVYMEIPPGFEGSMAKNQADHTLFVKKSHAGKMAILIVYVDDIILSGNDMEELQNLKKYLSEEFEVKDLGNLKYFLGMEVARSRKGIVVSQRKYILDLLKETGMLGCKPIDTPMDSQKKLGIEKESTPVDRGRYQRLVGRLIYLSHTRPDIGFAVSAVSQFMHSPTEEHMEAVYRILRYLKMTPGKGLFFRKTENRDTEVYSDADWAGNIIDRRSTSGYCSFVWGNLVTWRSKKQSVVARSSAEAEYRALAQGISISIAKNPVHHDRTKHVEIDRHFITEKVTSETVKLNYVPTKHQTADILTKALPRPNFEDLTCKLGLYDIYSPA